MEGEQFSRRYGSRIVFMPLPARTGELHAQPCDYQIRNEACCSLTADYETLFDARGALDAPEGIPSGGVRAQEFLSGGHRLLVGNVYRDGWRS